MARHLYIAFIFLLCIHQSVGQTRYTEYNQQQADHSKEELRSYYHLVSGLEATKKEIKGDKRKIAFLNEFYNKDLSAIEIAALMNKYKLRGSIDSSNLGGAMHYRSSINTKHFNLHTEIVYTTFQNKVVYKKISLETDSKSFWLDTLPANHHMLSDVHYLEKYCFPVIDFPLKYSIVFIPAVADTILAPDNVNSLYKLLPADSTNMNRWVWNGFTKYLVGSTLSNFKPAIKNRDTALLFRLLFSPNHILALHAMESLIYLRETEQVLIPVDINQKMEQLKNSVVEFKIQHSDVVRTGNYQSIPISTTQIVSKYKRLVARDD